MKGRSFPVFSLFCAVLLWASCAKNENPTDVELQRKSFEAWMSLYAPQAEKLESGIYREVIASSTKAAAKSPTDSSQWVRINYTGYTLLTGDVFVTRDAEIAKREGTFAYYTNYTSDYLQFYPITAAASNYYPVVGVYAALGTMKEGDKWRIYIPTDQAYAENGFTASESNYGGYKSLAANMPVMMDLELVEVVDNPRGDETGKVQNYAVNQMQLNLTDTIGPNVYIKHIGDIRAGGDKLLADSAVNVYYVGRLLDGFVFDTNIKDTADKYNLAQYRTRDYYERPMTFTAGQEESTTIAGMDSALLHMHYGEMAQVVMTSERAYGAEGDYTVGGTVIPAYTPLIFDLFVSPKHGDGSYELPYSAEGVLTKTEDEDDVWVYGCIFGYVPGDDVSGAFLGYYPEEEIKTNVMMANQDYVGNSNYENFFPVELPEGPIGDALNYPVNYRTFWQFRLKVRGDIRDYLGVKGLRNVTEYKIIH